MATAITPAPAAARIALKNILYLTDFSEPSEAALPFAISLAHGYGAKIHAVHVQLPQALTYSTPESMAVMLEAEDECARLERDRLDAELAGVRHDVSIVRDASVWNAVEAAIRNCAADVIVLGTSGRSGIARLVLGSTAEDIFRRSQIPVLTIGPFARVGMHSAGKFHSILFATDFTPHSLAAAPYAISLAQENQARLILFHVIRNSERELLAGQVVTPIDAAVRSLEKIVPEGAALWCKPMTMLGYGEPAGRILQVAREDHADLIVLGVNRVHRGRATHLERAIAHQVVAHATCPVLTVRG